MAVIRECAIFDEKYQTLEQLHYIYIFNIIKIDHQSFTNAKN